MGFFSLCLCLFKNPLPWIAVVLIILSGFLGSVFSTSLLLILSTLYFTFSKQRSLIFVEEKTEKHHETTLLLPMEEEKCLNLLNQIHEKNEEEEEENGVVLNQNHEKNEEEEEENGVVLNQNHEKNEEEEVNEESYLLESSNSSISQSTKSSVVDHSSTTTSVHDCDEEQELDWPFKDNVVNQSSKACFDEDEDDDGSISDEDSLIEIDLPSGHYCASSNDDDEDEDGYEEENEQPKLKLQQKMQAFSPQSIFGQHGSLMELFAEMNEEDNLIEIDISIGSIKCSRFEIEA